MAVFHLLSYQNHLPFQFIMGSGLIVDNPLIYDYSPLYDEVLGQLDSTETSLEVVIRSPIHDSKTLNEALTSVFTVIREKSKILGYDHSFQIDTYFNVDDVDALIKSRWNKVFYSEQLNLLAQDSVKLIELTVKTPSLKKNIDLLDTKDFRNYDTAAVGGTFDHIHDGHKILLLMTIFLTKRRIIVGVTGPQLLVNKKFGDLLESYELRQNSVVQYLQQHIDDDVKFEIYMINDVCGPTGFVNEINALVLSHETAKGGVFINNFRKEKNFTPLDIVTIDVIGGDGSAENNWKGKLSSTDIREKEYLKRQKTS